MMADCFAMIRWTNKDFVHLHCHSEYSQFDGLSPVDNLVTKAREMGFPALALTDHGTVGGLIQFVNACTATKDQDGILIPYDTIKPLLGAEFYVARDHRYKSKDKQPDGASGNRHLVLIAKNWSGYQNLCRLSQISWQDGFYMKPRIDMDLLSQHSEGLIAGSACLSSLINANLLHDRYDQAKRTAEILKDIFGEDFFLEIMYHGIEEERVIIPDILRLGKELDIPVACTNDAHYIEKDHAISQEVFTCMSSGKCIHDPDRLSQPYGEFYLKSAEEMARIFGFSRKLLLNTVAIANKVDFENIKENLFGGMRLPQFDIPEEFDSSEAYLRHLSYEGLKRLGWDNSQQHIDALEKELGDIHVAFENNNYDFATYFLIVWDYTNFAKKQGILCGPGRGSGYASVILRCLGITYGADPCRYGLLWERFLGFAKIRHIQATDFFS